MVQDFMAGADQYLEAVSLLMTWEIYLKYLYDPDGLSLE
jgi:hypothetical protein